MLSAAENRRITRTGAASPAGALLRQYWQPVALEEEFNEPRPVRAVRLLDEHLVAFRDAQGDYGLLDRQCPHRGADLCYGRLEDGGLRCAFHGWLFDINGACLEQPAEPPDSDYYQRIRHTAYPCAARNGIVFAYLGGGEPPPLPHLDCLHAPYAYTFAFKGFIDCNWLQALEVGIDPAHASFLHRFMHDDEDESGYGRQFRDHTAQERIPVTRLLREHPRPHISVEETDFGLRIFARRELDAQRAHIRVTNQVFPQAIVIPMSNEMTITQWHVPVDDESCYWFAIFTSFGEPVDHQLMRKQRLQLYTLPDYKPRLHRGNDWGYDPAEQASRTYTGMGDDINVHDQWAVESMGRIQNRTREHLGKSDVAIRAYRHALLTALAALENGDAPALPGHSHSDVLTVDDIVSVTDWRSAWRSSETARRQACAWLKDSR
ncbi:MAG: aromatic ring-hydroxylating dioxygenase subunit alpha [Gammaproteobacteria bacterium]|nr:aromatic ring-hydroxylating dioxygenase subunit alpha [Gammaproteobacteria bacterium]